MCVVAASEGYPGEFTKGVVVCGLERVKAAPDLQVFHSGTVRRANDIVTAGGRVLSTCALGKDSKEARERAYAAMKLVEFSGMHYRTDIAAR